MQGMDRTIYCDADSLWLSDAASLWAEFDAMADTVLFGMTIENEEPDGRCHWYSEGARGAENASGVWAVKGRRLSTARRIATQPVARPDERPGTSGASGRAPARLLGAFAQYLYPDNCSRGCRGRRLAGYHKCSSNADAPA